MYLSLETALIAASLLIKHTSSLPTKGLAQPRDDPVNWYSDSASGVAGSLEDKKRDSTNWYSDSASGVVGSLDKKSDDAANWYSDSASGVVGSLKDKKRDDTTNWYSDSASGVIGSLEKRDDSANWYSDSASGVSGSLEEKREDAANWYSDSASGVAGSLKNEKRDDGANWYSDSASGVVGLLKDRRVNSDSANWYSDSASGVAESVEEKRASPTARSLTAPEKQSYEKALRNWVYYDMRNKALRDSSERGKALFNFTPKPRSNIVDRWHVPDELLARYNVATSDAERVSVLNYYLMVTDREVKSAEDLGFTATSDVPVLPETNEVGYGYVLAGQHQYHCVNFVADAVEVGRERLNDFYLKHTIHCLGLFKWLTPQLTMKLPLGFFTPIAEERKISHYPQTIDELEDDAYIDE